jgi:hypothetical protein
MSRKYFELRPEAVAGWDSRDDDGSGDSVTRFLASRRIEALAGCNSESDSSAESTDTAPPNVRQHTTHEGR